MEMKPTKNERGRPLSVLRLPVFSLLHPFGLPETDLTQKPTRVEPEYARARFSNYLVGEAFANLVPKSERGDTPSWWTWKG